MAGVKSGFRFNDYREAKAQDVRAAKWRPPAEDEGLTGLVQGLSASDLEERVARSLYRYRIPFEFQVEIPTAFSLPTERRKVDFLVRGVQPLEPDGQIGHYANIGQKAHDTVRDMFLNEAFQQMGMRPIIHIPYYDIPDQEATDRVIKGLRL